MMDDLYGNSPGEGPFPEGKFTEIGTCAVSLERFSSEFPQWVQGKIDSDEPATGPLRVEILEKAAIGTTDIKEVVAVFDGEGIHDILQFDDVGFLLPMDGDMLSVRDLPFTEFPLYFFLGLHACGRVDIDRLGRRRHLAIFLF
jgi:hypothetical protein